MRLTRHALRNCCRCLLLLASVLVAANTMARFESQSASTLHIWAAETEPVAVLLALHGFNDHGGAFAGLGPKLAARGVTVYAYDQAGFGANADAGHWPGHERLVQDAAAWSRRLQQLYPDLPVYLLGKSMGGAVALLSAQRVEPAGVLLVAPALYGVRHVPWYQRGALWLVRSFVPGLGLPVRAGQALGYSPTDQPEVMAALRADPLVIDAPRADAVAGLQALMNVAAYTPPVVPTLLLYGLRDDLIPPKAVCSWLQHVRPLVPADRLQAQTYPDGYHMLLRFSGAAEVKSDLSRWLLDRDSATTQDLDAAQRAVCR